VSRIKQATGVNARTAIDVFPVPDRAGLWTLSALFQNASGDDVALLEEDFLVLVPPVTNFAYTLTLDKEVVLVGDIITATAHTNDTGTENITFVWIDPDGDIKESQIRPVGPSGGVEDSFVPDEQGQWRVGAQFNENTVRSIVFEVQERGATNHSPVAVNDMAITHEDVVVIINAISNDFDPDGDKLSAILNDDPTSGTLTLNANGSFTYIPGANFNGADSFTYHASDGSANSDVATVSIAVDAVNDPPVADAGSDQNVSEESAVSLNGSASDVDDTDLIFSWSQISGHASIALTDADTLSPSFIAPSINHSDPSSLQITLTFELVVTDAHGPNFTDTVAVVINDVNKAPSADAGQDQIVNESILCEEKGECDEDDDYKKSVIASGKDDDDDCKEKKDDALIESTSGDKDDEKCEILTAVTLSGSGSDADGDFLTFLWNQTDGPSVELSDVNSSTVSFIAPEVDEDTHLKFELVVSDGFGGIDTDTVDILVLDGDGDSHKKIKVTGGGSIGKNVNFGFEVQSKDGDVKGELEFQDKEADIKLHSISITTLTVRGDEEEAAFEGIGKIDGKEYEFTAEVEDNGKGKKDKFTIEIPERNYHVSGTLSGGNIQIHH
jgi:VCBS repeat-containing protein